jgi:hypothetical protein
MTQVDFFEDKKMLAPLNWQSSKWKTIKLKFPLEHRVKPKCCSHVPLYYKEHKQGNKLTSSYCMEYKQENELTSL